MHLHLLQLSVLPVAKTVAGAIMLQAIVIVTGQEQILLMHSLVVPPS